MITALAVFGGSVLFFICINLIVGIITRRNPFRYTPDQKPGAVDWAFVTILTLVFMIQVSLIVYCEATDHEICQSDMYRFFVVGVVVQLLVNAAYYCALIHAIRNYSNQSH